MQSVRSVGNKRPRYSAWSGYSSRCRVRRDRIRFDSTFNTLINSKTLNSAGHAHTTPVLVPCVDDAEKLSPGQAGRGSIEEEQSSSSQLRKVEAFLSAELSADAEALRKSISAAGSGQARAVASQFLKVLQKALEQNNSHQAQVLQRLCEAAMGKDGIPDEILLHVCKSFVTKDLSYNRAVAFANSVMFRQIAVLKVPASRVLVKLLLAAAKRQPQALLDGLLLPVLIGAHGTVSSCQIDVCMRVLKDGTRRDLLQQSFARLLLPHTASNPSQHGSLFALHNHNANASNSNNGCNSSSRSSSSSSDTGGGYDSDSHNHLVWTEETMPVVQYFLSSHAKFNEELARAFVSHLQGAVQPAEVLRGGGSAAGSGGGGGGRKVTDATADLRKSLKFNKVVLTFITRHKQWAAVHKLELQTVVASCRTFMAKQASTALGKL